MSTWVVVVALEEFPARKLGARGDANSVDEEN